MNTEVANKLYLLQDGTHADPSDVSKGKDGVLRHKNGLAVCLYQDGSPQTVGQDAVNNKNVEAAKAVDEPAAPHATAPAPAAPSVAEHVSAPKPAPAPAPARRK